MKKIIFFAVLACLLGGHAYGQMALDNQNIRKAKRAMDVTHSCDQAMTYLRLVSDSGKTKQEYALTMARANDCKANYEQAILHYTKYLEKDPGNDSVQKRLAELKDGKAQGGVAMRQQKIAKDHYKNAKDGFGGPCINDRDFTWGLSYDLFTGGRKAPYRHGYSFMNVYQRPFAKNRLLFDFFSYIGYMTGGRKSWFAQTLNTTDSNITKVPGTGNLGMELGLSVMAVNNHTVAVSVGPLLGFNAYLMQGVDAIGGSDGYSSPVMVSGVTGIRTALFVKKHFYCALTYAYHLKSTYRNVSEYDNSTTLTPVNGSSLRISIGIRGFGDPAPAYRPSYRYH